MFISLTHVKEIDEMKTEFGCAEFISLLCLLNASITQSVNSKLAAAGEFPMYPALLRSLHARARA